MLKMKTAVSASTGVPSGYIALYMKTTDQNPYLVFPDGSERRLEGSVLYSKWKDTPCRLATTENITLANEQTIDGESAVAGDRVLVWKQTDGRENGIYVVVDSGSWTRTTDCNESTEFVSAATTIIEGTANGGKVFICTVSDAFTISTDVNNWINIGSAPLSVGTVTGQILVWNNSTGLWEVGDASNLAHNDLDGLNEGDYLHLTAAEFANLGTLISLLAGTSTQMLRYNDSDELEATSAMTLDVNTTDVINTLTSPSTAGVIVSTAGDTSNTINQYIANKGDILQRVVSAYTEFVMNRNSLGDIKLLFSIKLQDTYDDDTIVMTIMDQTTPDVMFTITAGGKITSKYLRGTGNRVLLADTSGLVYAGTKTESDLHTHTNKDVLDGIIDSGDGDEFLSDDGSYKAISGLPTGTNGQTLRNNSGTWAANSVMTIKDESTYKQVIINGSGTNALAGLEVTHNKYSGNGSYAGLFQNKNSIGTGTNIGVGAFTYMSAGSNDIAFYGVVATGQYIIKGGTGSISFSVDSTGKIFSNSLTASKLVATNASKELVSTDLFALSGGSVVKMLTADDAIQSDTTLSTVSDFTQALLASSKYRITAKLIIHQVGGEADFKMQLAAPSGSTITGSYKKWIDGTNTEVVNNLYNDLTSVISVEMDAYTDAAGYYYLEIEGIIETSTTAGNFTFSFAQLNSIAEITTLKKYSIIELTKI